MTAERLTLYSFPLPVEQEVSGSIQASLGVLPVAIEQVRRLNLILRVVREPPPRVSPAQHRQIAKEADGDCSLCTSLADFAGDFFAPMPPNEHPLRADDEGDDRVHGGRLHHRFSPNKLEKSPRESDPSVLLEGVYSNWSALSTATLVSEAVSEAKEARAHTCCVLIDAGRRQHVSASRAQPGSISRQQGPRRRRGSQSPRRRCEGRVGSGVDALPFQVSAGVYGVPFSLFCNSFTVCITIRDSSRGVG